MQKLDKIFAGLVLVAMALFWVIISPAGITSRISEAKPISLEQFPGLDAEQAKAPLTEKQKRSLAERKAASQKVERLKDRRNDTPSLSKEEIRATFSAPIAAPQPGEKLQNLDDIPDLPVFY